MTSEVIKIFIWITNFTFLSLSEYLADSSPYRIYHIEVYHTLAQHIIAIKLSESILFNSISYRTWQEGLI